MYRYYRKALGLYRYRPPFDAAGTERGPRPAALLARPAVPGPFISGIYDSRGRQSHFSGNQPTLFYILVMQGISNFLQIVWKLLQPPATKTTLCTAEALSSCSASS